MRWWGWGEDAGAISLPEPALALLRQELEVNGSQAGTCPADAGVTTASGAVDPSPERIRTRSG